MRLTLQYQPFRADGEPFTLYIGSREIAVRAFYNDAGEASLGWVWTDGHAWSASIALRREEYAIRQARTVIARTGTELTFGPIRWQLDLLETHRVLIQQSAALRKPGNHTRVTWREHDSRAALAVALQSCSYRTPVTIRPAGITLAPALLGMLMITSYSQPGAGG